MAIIKSPIVIIEEGHTDGYTAEAIVNLDFETTVEVVDNE